MKVDFARLNYVLIPKTNEGRDRFRRSVPGRAVMPLVRFFGSLTDEGRTLLVLTILVGAFGLDVQRTSVYLLFAALAGLLAGSLAAAFGQRLDGATLSVEAPRRAAVKEAVTFTVTCRGAPAHAGTLRVRGPFLPWDGAWLEVAAGETSVGEDGIGRATLRARFVARGEHHLEAFTAGAIAPLGLACGPRIATETIKCTIVPRVANVVRLPAAVATRHQPGGVALASKSGEAMKLAGVRPYRPGDPVRDLHARSWARAGFPVVREYQQEYFTRVGVVLDTDSADPDRLEAAIELAAGVVANLSRGEALVDVLVLGDRVHELTVGRSLGYLDQALDLLASVERGPRLRAADVSRRLDPYLDRLSSVVIVALERAETEAVEAAIRRRGVATTAITVDAELARAIRRGKALAW